MLLLCDILVIIVVRRPLKGKNRVISNEMRIGGPPSQKNNCVRVFLSITAVSQYIGMDPYTFCIIRNKLVTPINFL